jgi:hypothetical protein
VTQQYLVLVSYDGDPNQMRQTEQANPTIMEKIKAKAQELGCEALIVVKGEKLCGTQNLFGASVWNNAESARRFYEHDPNVAIIASKAGISSRRLTTQAYQFEDGIQGAFFQTEPLRSSLDLVGARASR